MAYLWQASAQNPDVRGWKKMVGGERTEAAVADEE
jgi:hypothetical protein